MYASPAWVSIPCAGSECPPAITGISVGAGTTSSQRCGLLGACGSPSALGCVLAYWNPGTDVSSGTVPSKMVLWGSVGTSALPLAEEGVTLK